MAFTDEEIMVSLDPFVARRIRIYGEAADPVERVGIVGPGIHARVTPVAWSASSSAHSCPTPAVRSGACEN